MSDEPEFIRFGNEDVESDDRYDTQHLDVHNCGTTILHYAAESGNLELVKFLVEKGANINAGEDREHNDSIVNAAVRSKNQKLVNWLKKQGAKSNYLLSMELKYAAADEDNLPYLKLVVKHGADVNEVIDDGYHTTPLGHAAKEGNMDMVKWLVENGADVNAKGWGDIALHLAAKKGNLEMVKYLVEHGANVNAKDGGAVTALFRAKDSGNRQVIEYLKAHGAK